MAITIRASRISGRAPWMGAVTFDALVRIRSADPTNQSLRTKQSGRTVLGQTGSPLRLSAYGGTLIITWRIRADLSRRLDAREIANLSLPARLVWRFSFPSIRDDPQQPLRRVIRPPADRWRGDGGMAVGSNPSHRVARRGGAIQLTTAYQMVWGLQEPPPSGRGVFGMGDPFVVRTKIALEPAEVEPVVPVPV